MSMKFAIDAWNWFCWFKSHQISSCRFFNFKLWNIFSHNHFHLLNICSHLRLTLHTRISGMSYQNQKTLRCVFTDRSILVFILFFKLQKWLKGEFWMWIMFLIVNVAIYRIRLLIVIFCSLSSYGIICNLTTISYYTSNNVSFNGFPSFCFNTNFQIWI